MTIPDTMAAINRIEELMNALLRGDVDAHSTEDVYIDVLKWCVEIRLKVLSLFPPVPLAPAAGNASGPPG